MRSTGFQHCILLLYVLVLSGLAYAQEISKPNPVKVATPQHGKIEQKATYTGNLEAEAMVEIYANTSGKLVTLKVHEGDRINKGDVLAETDSRELHLALKQAEAARGAAEAQLLTVKATSRVQIKAKVKAAEAVLDAAKAQLKQAKTLAQTKVTSQLTQAEAGVRIAEAQLRKALKGARNQEIQLAKAAVSGAKASLENAQANFQRMQELHKKEAISDQNFDSAKAQLDASEAQHKSTLEQLSLVEEGAQHEDITAAEAQLDQARASLTIADVTATTKDWETQIALSESQVKQAEANLSSAQELVNVRAWEHEITAAEAQANQASEQVNLAKKRLADATIIAPLSGIVVNRTVDIGDYANAAGSPVSNPILTIVKMDVVKAVFSVPEDDLSNVTDGTEVRISVGQQHIDGKINFISPIVKPENRTVQVKAEISNPMYRLKPGMFVEVSIDLSSDGEALLLPRGTVLDIQDKVGHVFVATDGKAHQQTVKIGLAWGEHISILQGLTNATPVIVSGHRQLADGMEILIIK